MKLYGLKKRIDHVVYDIDDDNDNYDLEIHDDKFPFAFLSFC